MRRRLSLLLPLLAACNLENSLGGSVSENFPLDISGVELSRNHEAFQVTYYRNRGVFLDVVARVSVSLFQEGVSEDGGVPWIEPAPGTRIGLTGEFLPGHPRTAVTHAPGGEPVRNLPRITRGDLAFTEGGNIGEVTGGDFSMLFEEAGGDLGWGRTLFGTFRGEVLDAGFGELP